MRYLFNKETLKSELHFGKQEYNELSTELKDKIKSAFLWSGSRGCWVSRSKKPNLYRANEVAKEFGFNDCEVIGSYLPFAEQIERQKERAEARAERYEEYADNAASRGASMQSGIKQYNFLNELIIDSFAGGGGASTGIELALGRIVDIAINHDINAIKMHEMNHPFTKHYCENIFKVDPLQATQGRPVGVMWASPDCTHFSKAKGGKPVKKEIRGLAWVILRLASAVKPRVIILENVPEFQDWCPIKNGQPIKERKGETFNQFVGHLRNLGYKVEWRVLDASDYGAGTSRKRLYLIARCDGEAIIFPDPTHGEKKGLKPKRKTADFIDFSIRGKSIFNRKKPLADATMRRIAKGTDKFTIKNSNPFIIECNHGGERSAKSIDKQLHTITQKDTTAFVAPKLEPYYSNGKAVDVKSSLPTSTTKDRTALIENHLCVLRNNMDCKPLNKSLPTITTSPGHFAHIKTYLVKYAPGTDLMNWTHIRKMLNDYAGYSIADDEVLILEINNVQYFIGDIEMRMLLPRELYGCQGFPPDYIIDRTSDGKKLPIHEQVKKVGNSVCPPVATALVKANVTWLAIKEPLRTMEELYKAVAQ